MTRDIFEEKGKIFTPRISKLPIPVIIQTLTHRIQGKIHVRPDHRLLDEVNEAGPFIAVTQATVFDARGKPIYTTAFLSLNREQIVWLFPVEEATEAEP